MNDILSNITIIMPTYNRKFFVLRNMRFWSNKGPILHVLDGSRDKISSEELKYFGANIYYHHIPEDYYSRLGYAKNLIDTKYSIMQCDDEMYIPSALAECVKILDASSEIISCIGHCMGFKYENHDIVVTEKFNPIKLSENNLSSSLERLLFKASNYLPSTYYGLNRTEVFISNIEIIIMQSSSPYSGEVFVEFSNSIHGKSKVIDNLMWFRNYENDPIHDLNWDRNITLDLWYHNNKIRDEVTSYLIDSAEIIAKSSGVSQNKIIKYLIVAMNLMCGINYKISDYKSLLISYRGILKTKTSKLLGKHMYSGYTNRFGWISFEDYRDKILDPENITFNSDEISDIFDFIKNTHLNL
jgi:glycosyltransferase domain-containing protein